MPLEEVTPLPIPDLIPALIFYYILVEPAPLFKFVYLLMFIFS